jgi:hypothetical protein
MGNVLEATSMYFLSAFMECSVDSLVTSLNDVIDTTEIVKTLVQGGIRLIDIIIDNQVEVERNVEALLTELNSICPSVRDPLCTDISDVSTCNFDGVFEGDAVSDFVAFWADAKSVSYDELEKSRSDLEELLTVIEDLNSTGKNFNWAFYCSMGFSLALAFLCLWVLLGAYFRLSKVTKCFQHFVLVPIFILLVVLSWVFSMVFVVGSIGLADMCLDSPDSRMISLLQKHKSGFSPLIFGLIIFYISGK